MSIIRAPRPESGWTAFANDVCRDERISDKARGLLLRMLSHADNYRFSSDRLAYERTGRDAIQTALRELEAAGYVRRSTTRDERGRITTTTYVYDVPSSPDLPARENPGPDYPPPEKPSPKEVPSKERPSKERPSKDLKTETADDLAVAAPSESQIANAIAKAIYDGADGMHDFQKLRAVASKGLKAGYSAEQIVAAMRQADADGRPLTAQVVRQHIVGASGTRVSTATARERERAERLARYAAEDADRKALGA